MKIIPISKLLGNYNWGNSHATRQSIIPISKLLGNYNSVQLCGWIAISSNTKHTHSSLHHISKLTIYWKIRVITAHLCDDIKPPFILWMHTNHHTRSALKLLTQLEQRDRAEGFLWKPKQHHLRPLEVLILPLYLVRRPFALKSQRPLTTWVSHCYILIAQ